MLLILTNMVTFRVSWFTALLSTKSETIKLILVFIFNLQYYGMPMAVKISYTERFIPQRPAVEAK